MGPTVVFDKSFLQTLTLDESVWFDHFFVPIITPLFFVETLADLEKETIRAGRTPEDEVRIIADKTPEMNSVPHVHHLNICHDELLGFRVPFNGRPVIPEGRRAIVDGKKGIFVGVSDEAEALRRWRDEEFREVERRFARNWRTGLAAMSHNAGARFLENLDKQAADCTRREQLRELARTVVTDTAEPPHRRMGFVFDVLGITDRRAAIFRRFTEAGAPSLAAYSPFTAHVLEVEIYFRLAMRRGIESAERPSNWADAAYLNYLPTCHVMVSTDRLHRENSPLFTRPYQAFVWGPDLKADLRRLNEHFLRLPQEAKDRGVMSFAGRPPTDGDFLTAQLWDVAMKPSWRNPQPANIPEALQKNAVESLKAVKTAALAERTPPVFSSDEADVITVERRIRRRKGSWTLVPPEITG